MGWLDKILCSPAYAAVYRDPDDWPRDESGGGSWWFSIDDIAILLFFALSIQILYFLFTRPLQKAEDTSALWAVVITIALIVILPHDVRVTVGWVELAIIIVCKSPWVSNFAKRAADEEYRKIPVVVEHGGRSYFKDDDNYPIWDCGSGCISVAIRDSVKFVRETDHFKEFTFVDVPVYHANADSKLDMGRKRTITVSFYKDEKRFHVDSPVSFSVTSPASIRVLTEFYYIA
jgi:hypothetical protein